MRATPQRPGPLTETVSGPVLPLVLLSRRTAAAWVRRIAGAGTAPYRCGVEEGTP
ncbi:hypothetical protein [Streptomyces phaeolivaceus]|uniref:hypothetical protein n=1 Tax=Streptomyces phaeolivaceus TaxID=2653200 RepID=UPI00186A5784|nr:hypothetical protein [Streptomyces phaeolivaceus]